MLEAQNDVANGTTKANSAIIHAGYDPEPGTQMARLNVQGNRMAGEICEKLGVPFARVGSLVLAFCEAERQTLETLFQRGQANGVPGLRLLDGAGARAMEPKPQRSRAGRAVCAQRGHCGPVAVCPCHG